MAGATTETVLGKINQGHSDCPVCSSRFKDPKILDCLHSFCVSCLEEMLNEQQLLGTDTITCPVCRRQTPVPVTGLQGIPNSYVLSSLVDEVNQQEQELGDASAPSQTCECAEGLEAVWRCLDCNENICQKCREAHERLKYTKDHRIIPMEDFNKGRLSLNCHGKTATPKCRNHGDNDVHFYCDTCKTLICAMCAATDHRLAEHSYGGIDDFIESFREDVNDFLQKFEKTRQQFNATDAVIEQAREQLRKNVVVARSDISAKAEEEIGKIREKARLLEAKVTTIGEERDETYEKVLNSNRDKMERANQIVATVTDMMQQAEILELVNLKPKVMYNLELQRGLQFETARHVRPFIGVRCRNVVGDADLAEILHEEHWQLMKRFGKEGTNEGEFQFGRGVACFSNGDIVVVDTTSRRLSVFTSSGHYKTSVARGDKTHGLETPWDVAATCDDLLLVTEKQKVKVFDSELQMIREFTPSLEDAGELSKSYLTGIAVDEENRVAVADKGRKVISLHNLDGSLIGSVSNVMIENDLAMGNKRLIFTNYGEFKLVGVDFKGKEVLNVNTCIDGKPAKPTGVLCNDNGDIYVAVHFGKVGTAEVQHYDRNGVFVGTIFHRLHNPGGMAFTPAGDVVVADKCSVKVFHRV